MRFVPEDLKDPAFRGAVQTMAYADTFRLAGAPSVFWIVLASLSSLLMLVQVLPYLYWRGRAIAEVVVDDGLGSFIGRG